MNKMFNTLILAVTAILLSSSYSVYASNYEYNKCTMQDGGVIFQDAPCADAWKEEAMSISSSSFTTKNSGLRDYEKVVLARYAARRAHDQILRALIKKSIIDSYKANDLK